MRLVIIIMVTCLMQVSAAGFAQRLTYAKKNTTLAQVFTEIKKQTGYNVLYSDQKVDGRRKLSVDFQNTALEDVLGVLLDGQPLGYEIDQKTILIKEKTPSFLDKVANYFVDIDVRGRVVDSETGEGLPGATVKVKGTNKQTSTNGNGQFYLENVEEVAVLVISYIGYKTVEINVAKDMGMIKMELGNSELEEVIVSTGYWTTTARKSLGNISKVTTKEIENQPVTSPLLALQGRMAGVEVIPRSGAPGSAVSIRIRGQNSIRTTSSPQAIDGNLPLYIIDGVPIDPTPIRGNSLSLFRDGFDPLSSINPDNIESIQVLKDADATAIYGSRGANGVVLVTTKNKFGLDKTELTAGYYRGAGKLVQRVETLNLEEYLTMQKEALQNGDANTQSMYENPVFGPLYFKSLLLWDSVKTTDYQDILLGGTSDIENAQINLSGGTARANFTSGATYHKETLLFPGDFGYKRFTGNLGFNYASLDQRLKTSFSVDYGANRHKVFDNDAMMANALHFAPNTPSLYNDDGSLNWGPVIDLGFIKFSSWSNPLSWVRVTQEATANNFIGKGNINYEIARGLSGKVNFGYSHIDQRETIISPISALDPNLLGQKLGSSRYLENVRSSFVVEPQLAYSKIQGFHSLNAMVGMTWQQSESSRINFEGIGFTSDASLGTLQGAPVIKSNASNYQYKYNATYARVGYEYKNRYLVNLTGRRDGSSRFGPDKRFGNFGAIGVGWIFSEENFLKNSSMLSFGKVRFSYGTTGNDQIGDSRYLRTYTITPGTYGGVVSIIPTGHLNTEYAWEETQKLEAALEFGLVNDRISTVISWHKNRSSNQLTEYVLPDITGFSSVLANFAATVQNSGWEFVLNTRNIYTSTFSWSTSLNLSLLRNKLVAFPGIENSSYASLYEVGKPLNMYRGYKWDGVDPQTGIHNFKDIDGNGSITSNDQTFLTDGFSDYFGGVLNTFNHKSIELSFLIQLSKGVKKIAYFAAPGTVGNQPVSVMNRWRKPGDLTAVQKFVTSFDADAIAAYDRWMESDAALQKISFARLKTVSLSYSFPESFIQKVKLKSAKVFLQAQNLLTITNFDGWDPETIYGVPPLRIVTVGAQIKL